MSKKSKEKQFKTVDAYARLRNNMQVAINNMIEEVEKPVDQTINGSARKAELQSIKQTAVDCRELIMEIQKIDTLIKELNENGEISEEKDYTGGFAERNAQ